MKISKMILELKKAQKQFGDIEVVMSSDSEGNSFSTIDESLRYSRVYENEHDFVKAYEAGTISGPATEVVDNFFKKAKVVGLCLYPFAEDFEYAEKAVKYAQEKEKIKESAQRA